MSDKSQTTNVSKEYLEQFTALLDLFIFQIESDPVREELENALIRFKDGMAMESKTTEKKRRANYLTTLQSFNLETVSGVLSKACLPLGYGVYHVGSSITRPDWRDVDLRCIMQDDKFDALFGK